MRTPYRIAKMFFQKFKPQIHCISTASGEQIIEKQEIAERWKENREELCDNTDMNTSAKENLIMDKLAERELQHSNQKIYFTLLTLICLYTKYLLIYSPLCLYTKYLYDFCTLCLLFVNVVICMAEQVFSS